MIDKRPRLWRGMFDIYNKWFFTISHCVNYFFLDRKIENLCKANTFHILKYHAFWVDDELELFCYHVNYSMLHNP